MALYGTLLAESVRKTRGLGDTVEAYNFGSCSLEECTGIIAYNIEDSVNEMVEMVTVTDEILAEAAINNPDALDSLSESVFSGIIDGVKKFFNKIISMITGIIDKLMAHIYQVTGKTDKWLKIMEPKIKDVLQHQGGYEDVEYEMYEYDPDYINDGMAVGFGNLVAAFDTEAKTMSGGNSMKSAIGKIKGRINSQAGRTPLPDQVNAANADNPNLQEINNLSKEIQTSLSHFTEDFWKIVAGHMGVNGAKTKEEVWAYCIKKARKSDTADKKAIKFGRDADTMLTAIKNSNKGVSAIKDHYKTHLEAVKKLRDEYTAIASEADSAVKESTRVPKNVTDALVALIRAHSDAMVKKVGLYEGALNSGRDKNVALQKELMSTYMSALTKLASYKAPKK